MLNLAPVILGLLFAASSLAAEGYPQEVADYIERREACEHFRQEPWPEGSSAKDRERRAFIVARFKRYCTGIDRANRALKEKFQNDKAVMERLEKYDADIEGRP
jgi:hypothetical protein